MSWKLNMFLLYPMLVDEYKKVLSQVERLVRPAQNSFLQHQS